MGDLRSGVSYFLAPGIGVNPQYDTAEYVKKTVCTFFGLDSKVVFTKNRKRALVWPRQITAYLLKKHTKYSLQKIGSKVGGADHATVLHSIKTVKNLMQVDSDCFATVQLLDKMVTNSLLDVFDLIKVAVSDEFGVSLGELSNSHLTAVDPAYKYYVGMVWLFQSISKISSDELSKVIGVSPEALKIILDDKYAFSLESKSYQVLLFDIRGKVEEMIESK